MSFRCAATLALWTFVLTGCQEREVQSYRIPKEKVDPPVAAAASPATSSTAANALTWAAPAHWQTKEAGGFRRGSFTLPGADGADADFSIIAFPGAAGGLVENLNRWRSQIGLPAFTEPEANDQLQHIDGTGGMHFHVVDFEGVAEGRPTRILGAVVEHGGESWFFKVMGPSETVAAEKAAFLAFLNTVRPASR